MKIIQTGIGEKQIEVVAGVVFGIRQIQITIGGASRNGCGSAGEIAGYEVCCGQCGRHVLVDDGRLGRRQTGIRNGITLRGQQFPCGWIYPNVSCDNILRDDVIIAYYAEV